MTQVFVSLPARAAPVKTEGLGPWVRSNFMASVPNAIVSALIVGILIWVLFGALRWGVFNAVFAANADLCQAARGIGACWGVVNEKARFIVLGRYPQPEHWRPVIATLLLLGLVVASCSPKFWKRWLPALWLVILAVFFVPSFIPYTAR